MKKWYWWVLLIGGVVLAGAEVFTLRQKTPPPVVLEDTQPAEQQKEETKPTPLIKTVTPPLPDSLLVDLPFTTQAPFGVWDQLHEEACEEASILMIYAARSGKTLGDATSVDKELRRLVDWETAHEYGEDLTVKQLQEVALAFYGLKGGKIVENPTTTELKEFISQKSLVIVPAAGRVLPNPYFTPPGPNYHMLVLRGYTDTHFITNDPGTKRGEKLTYTYSQLLNANHDYVSGDITNGRRRVLVYQ